MLDAVDFFLMLGFVFLYIHAFYINRLYHMIN